MLDPEKRPNSNFEFLLERFFSCILPWGHGVGSCVPEGEKHKDEFPICKIDPASVMEAGFCHAEKE